MLSLMLTMLAVGWKVALIVGVVMLNYDQANRSHIQYTNQSALIGLAVFCICFGLAIGLWISRHLPTDLMFWTTWYFVDDVATVSLTWGSTTLIRLVHHHLSQNK
jgi:hypothetical protein